MGEKKNKRERFFKDNPTCIFCGETQAKEIDHIPSRECFIDKVGPEDFEFPACKNCNHQASQFEQVAALYLHSYPSSGKEISDKQFRKIIEGVANNNPTALPNVRMTANQKRSALKDFHQNTGEIITYADAPLVEITEEALDALQVFNRKLACAIYFKETRNIIPQSAYMMTLQLPLGLKSNDTIINFAKSQLGNFTLSKRSNTNIGDQFGYLWNTNTDNTFFAYAAQFHQSMILFAAISLLDESNEEYWIKHSVDIENSWRLKPILKP